MTAHRHAALIKAKADNMDLVVLRKHYEGDWIEVADQSEIRIKQNGEYFLCLPQHKEACLHWLNGGNAQCKPDDEPSNGFEYYWDQLQGCEDLPWSNECVWMSNEKIRIKPRKEKRWICIKKSNKEVHPYLYESLEKAKDINIPRWWSYHEIEVEV